MADDPPIVLGHQRSHTVTVAPQGLHKIGFGCGWKRGEVHCSHAGPVARRFRSHGDAHLNRRDVGRVFLLHADGVIAGIDMVDLAGDAR